MLEEVPKLSRTDSKEIRGNGEGQKDIKGLKAVMAALIMATSATNFTAASVLSLLDNPYTKFSSLSTTEQGQVTSNLLASWLVNPFDSWQG